MAFTTRQRQKIIRILVWLMPVAILVTITTAWIFYPEPYEIFYESISALGGIYSEHGLMNAKGSLVMNIGFGITAALGITISIIYFIRTDLDAHILKACLTLIVGLGAIGIALPHDKSGLIFYHFMGAFTFITAFGVYNFIAQVFRFIRKHKPKQANKPPTGILISALCVCSCWSFCSILWW